MTPSSNAATENDCPILRRKVFSSSMLIMLASDLVAARLSVSPATAMKKSR